MSVASISLPVNAFRVLYKPAKDKVVAEIDLSLLARANQPRTVDEIVAEAKLEYYAGKTKGYSDIQDLLINLKS